PPHVHPIVNGELDPRSEFTQRPAAEPGLVTELPFPRLQRTSVERVGLRLLEIRVQVGIARVPGGRDGVVGIGYLGEARPPDDPRIIRVSNLCEPLAHQGDHLAVHVEKVFARVVVEDERASRSGRLHRGTRWLPAERADCRAGGLVVEIPRVAYLVPE